MSVKPTFRPDNLRAEVEVDNTVSAPKNRTEKSMKADENRKARALRGPVKFRMYDRIIVAFSGGKDSVACFLRLLELGVDRKKIELWHHDIDGNEGSDFMDWPCTRDYCRKFAEVFGVPIYFSWLVGGFEREMTKKNAQRAPYRFQVPGGETVEIDSGRSIRSTRMLFPQVTADLAQRWCSSYLKIDTCSIAINNQKRFLGKWTLLVSGERAAESTGRSRYNEYEIESRNHREGGRIRRVVHRWRAVHKWSDEQIWDIYKRWGVVPHPCYRLGIGRCSCQFCIFGSSNQFATARAVSRSRFENVARYERMFSMTMKRGTSLEAFVSKGKSFPYEKKDAIAANSKTYTDPILVDPKTWKLPLGAFGDDSGPPT